jgi:hypothetical protein
MIADIERAERLDQYIDEKRMPMAEAVGAAVEMAVPIGPSVDIVYLEALAPADDQIDAGRFKNLDPVRGLNASGRRQQYISFHRASPHEMNFDLPDVIGFLPGPQRMPGPSSSLR